MDSTCKSLCTSFDKICQSIKCACYYTQYSNVNCLHFSTPAYGHFILFQCSVSHSDSHSLWIHWLRQEEGFFSYSCWSVLVLFLRIAVLCGCLNLRVFYIRYLLISFISMAESMFFEKFQMYNSSFSIVYAFAFNLSKNFAITSFEWNHI